MSNVKNYDDVPEEVFEWLENQGFEPSHMHSGDVVLVANAWLAGKASAKRCACGGNPHTVTCPMKPQDPDLKRHGN